MYWCMFVDQYSMDCCLCWLLILASVCLWHTILWASVYICLRMPWTCSCGSVFYELVHMCGSVISQWMCMGLLQANLVCVSLSTYSNLVFLCIVYGVVWYDLGSAFGSVPAGIWCFLVPEQVLSLYVVVHMGIGVSCVKLPWLLSPPPPPP